MSQKRPSLSDFQGRADIRAVADNDLHESPNQLAETSLVDERSTRGRAAWNHIVTCFSFLALGFVFTLPGSLSLNAALLGYPGDNFQHAWFLWHFARAVLHAQNPFYTHLIFSPSHVNLAWSTTDPLAGFLALPFSVFAGPVFAYNASIILQLALSAFFARLLCLRITRNQPAAFVGGMIFGFSPYLMAHALEHLSLVTAFPIPLFVLALDRISSSERPSWKSGILLGAALLLAAMAHYNYVVLCVIFALFYLAIEISSRSRKGALRPTARLWKPLSAGAATFIVGFTPWLWMLLGARPEIPEPRPPGHIDIFSADALGFLIPSWSHILLGRFARRMNPAIFAAGIEGTVYIGVVVLALAAIGSWKGRESNRRWAIRASILAGAFYLLSLGPRVHVLGHALDLPGPAALLFDLPFAKFFSAPARFDAMTALCVAILSSLGVKFLLESTVNRNHRYWILPAIFALVLADYLTIPFPRSSTVNPGKGYSASKQIAAVSGCTLPRQLQSGTVLTFPMVKAPYCFKSTWMQVSDEGRFAIVDGYLSYTPPDVWKPLWNVPILRSLMSIEGGNQARIDTASDAASAADTIRELNLTAAVVFDSPERDAGVAYIENVFGVKPERSGSCTIFPLQPPNANDKEVF